MKKQEFILKLRSKLIDLPQQDVKERINFYIEMIDDRMDDGLCEEDAVRDMGTIDEIAENIRNEFIVIRPSFNQNAEERKPNASTITALAVGSPLWIALAATVFAIAISLYASVWSVVISLWAVFVTLVIASPLSLIMGFVFLFVGNNVSCGLMFSAAFLCFGISILLFFAAKALTIVSVIFTKKSCGAIKNLFSKE